MKRIIQAAAIGAASIFLSAQAVSSEDPWEELGNAAKQAKQSAATQAQSEPDGAREDIGIFTGNPYAKFWDEDEKKRMKELSDRAGKIMGGFLRGASKARSNAIEDGHLSSDTPDPWKVLGDVGKMATEKGANPRAVQEQMQALREVISNDESVDRSSE